MVLLIIEQDHGPVPGLGAALVGIVFPGKAHMVFIFPLDLGVQCTRKAAPAYHDLCRLYTERSPVIGNGVFGSVSHGHVHARAHAFPEGLKAEFHGDFDIAQKMGGQAEPVFVMLPERGRFSFFGFHILPDIDDPVDFVENKTAHFAFEFAE